MKTLLENARAIDGLTPRFEAQPTTPEELAEALSRANDEGLAVAPCGGGTQLDLGNVPKRLDLLLATTGLNRVVEYEPADLTVTVEAGMRFSDLQALLAEQGQFLALDPAAEPEATIGGLIATNASGPLRFAYGTARDLVIGTRVANPDGTLTRAGGRVVKNVAGYDLNKLYVGSLGTLAVIVELSFKLAPIPPSLATVVGQFESSASARDAIGAILRSPLSPLAIELLAPHTLVFRVGGYPQAVERQVRDLDQLIAAHAGQTRDSPETVWEDLTTVRRDAMQRDVVLKAAAPIAQSARLVELLEAAPGGPGAISMGERGQRRGVCRLLGAGFITRAAGIKAAGTGAWRQRVTCRAALSAQPQAGDRRLGRSGPEPGPHAGAEGKARSARHAESGSVRWPSLAPRTRCTTSSTRSC